ncbi:MAG TPA: 2-oxoglutarate dehydrogenase E1 component [Gammaproteobacteria bacterium]|nr:2-oxoglutarate dehydrogenase E1 component [Gammaproteobacteria bacterium]
MADFGDTPVYGGNASYLEDLYHRFLSDPGAVPGQWRRFFAELDAGGGAAGVDHEAVRAALIAEAAAPKVFSAQPSTPAESKQVAVLQLINAYRFRGHQQADLDPLGLQEQIPVTELDPAFHGLTEADWDTVFSTGSFVGPPHASLREIVTMLRSAYCGELAAEYMHITDTAQKRWIQGHMEDPGARPVFSAKERRHILRRLIAAEGLEQYLHTKYVGQKRFSLEGGESLIPLMDELLQRAGAQHVREVVLGMAHRGRLNMLVNVLGKAPRALFQEFEGKLDAPGLGDVKYHQGFSSDIQSPGGAIHLALAFNPSHLEIIDPVVEGSVRARQDRRGDATGDQVLPVLIHGDAAFAGQGVVMETFNMSQARGYRTHGTVHIVINNQIGFTTSNPLDARSTLYCTEVARMVQAPILHVNGDRPEAVVRAARMALDFRMRFKRDVVIDLVCYRRHGHSEADEPAVTQPVMYRAIRGHDAVTRLYARRLEQDGVIGADDAKTWVREYRQQLEQGALVAPHIVPNVESKYARGWAPYVGTSWDEAVDTALAAAQINKLSQALLRIPEGFKLHPQVARIVKTRLAMAAGEHNIDWGFAETLAYASLLAKGYPVRLSGQDSGRGTFFHRHAVLHHQENGDVYIPLAHISPRQARFTVVDSLLSEEAVLGFEYGYATAGPEGLVIWEAQFGDFANGAQVVIDQFISSGEVKWGRLAGLVVLLPHGYDGQGPEHSSARLERYLQLCAGDNMQVCSPTTPAQMFHMLRRQALRKYRKPLIVMSPKSLLRHPLSVSSLADLSGGAFRTVIGEVDDIEPQAVRRVVLCTGKVYFDVLRERRERGLQDIAIIRIEQLNPFPAEALAAVLAPYEGADEWLWCQEEPQNQGAWNHLRHRLEPYTAGRPLHYAGRPAYAAPAEGFLVKHQQAQAALVNQALAPFEVPTATELHTHRRARRA